MADAVALCALARVLCEVATGIYRSHFGGSVDSQATQSSLRQPSTRAKSAMKTMRNKVSKKMRHVAGAGVVKESSAGDIKSEKASKESKNLTERIADTSKGFDPVHEKQQALVDEAKLEEEAEALKKRLHAQQAAAAAEQRQTKQEMAKTVEQEREKTVLKQQVQSEQQNTLAAEQRFEEQIIINHNLMQSRNALETCLNVERERSFADRSYAIQQGMKAEAEKKVLLDALNHANTMAYSKQQDLQEAHAAGAALRQHLEDAEKRVQAAEKTGDEQNLKSFEMEQRVRQAEAQIKQVQSKLDSAISELAHAHHEKSRHEAVVDQMQAIIETTEKALEEANAVRTKLRDDLDDEEESTKCLEETNHKLAADFAESKALADRLQTLLDGHKKQEKEGAHVELKKLEEVNAELQKKTAGLDVQIKQLKESLDISENEALQNQADFDDARAQNNALTELLNAANKRVKGKPIPTFDLTKIDDFDDIDEIREKLAQTSQQCYDTQVALGQANERLSLENLVNLGNIATITSKDEWINNLERTLSEREEKLSMLKSRLERMAKLTTKNMADFCELGVEEDMELRERCVKKNMQQRIPYCDYLKWECDEMLILAKQSE